MRTPAELREASRLAREAASAEAELHIRMRLANHALALAQLAERIEREEEADKTIKIGFG